MLCFLPGHVVLFLITSLTAGQVATPGEVPLAHEQLRANHLVARVTLVGHHRAMHQLRVGGALPAVGDLWKLWACVVTRNLWGSGEREREREILIAIIALILR